MRISSSCYDDRILIITLMFFPDFGGWRGGGPVWGDRSHPMHTVPLRATNGVGRATNKSKQMWIPTTRCSQQDRRTSTDTRGRARVEDERSLDSLPPLLDDSHGAWGRFSCWLRG